MEYHQGEKIGELSENTPPTPIHTFEIRSQITPSEYWECRSFLFQTARNTGTRCWDDSAKGLISTRWSEIGVIVYLKPLQQNGFSYHLLSLRINPSVTTGNYDAAALFIATEEALRNVLSLVEDRILSQFPLGERQPLFLKRLDLTTDVILPKIVANEYFHLCNKIGKLHRWEKISFKDERDQHSFRRESSRYTFTIYDKSYQMQQENLVSSFNTLEASLTVVRFELSLKSKGIVRSLSNDTESAVNNIVSQITDLSNRGLENLCSVSRKIISDKSFVSLSIAKKVIKAASFSNSKKDNIVSFLTNVNRCRFIDVSALKKNVKSKKRLEQLDQLCLCPAMIRARSGLQSLPCIQDLIIKSVQGRDCKIIESKAYIVL